jgi:phage baseplate assembly protein W
MRKFTYSDFDPKLSLTRSGNIKINYDEDAIAQSIRNILATVKGERVRSDFGGGLVRFLFEPISVETAESIRYNLIQNIANFEPRVEVQRVLVLPDPDSNTYRVSVELFITELAVRKIFETRLQSFSSN